ncbi:MAG: 50S ribosomal protein L1 [Thermofilaceae archaeon]
MSVKIDRVIKAIEEAKSKAKPRRFVQSYEMVVKLRDIDVKQSENRFVELVVLPYPPPDKLSTVAVIAEGDLMLRAKEAGADVVLSRADLEKIAASKKEAKKLAKKYDVFLAQADLMPLVGRLLGRYLGPRAKMPQPILPSADLAAAIDRAKRSVRIKLRDQPQIACKIGSEIQNPKEVAENAATVLSFLLNRFKPYNIEKVYLKLSMGPPVEVAVI